VIKKEISEYHNKERALGIDAIAREKATGSYNELIKKTKLHIETLGQLPEIVELSKIGLDKLTEAQIKNAISWAYAKNQATAHKQQMDTVKNLAMSYLELARTTGKTGIEAELLKNKFITLPNYIKDGLRVLYGFVEARRKDVKLDEEAKSIKEQIMTPMERYQKALEEIHKLHRANKLTTDEHNRALEHAKKIIQETQNALKPKDAIEANSLKATMAMAEMAITGGVGKGIIAQAVGKGRGALKPLRIGGSSKRGTGKAVESLDKIAMACQRTADIAVAHWGRAVPLETDEANLGV
jgi:hypothetical protein